MAEREQGWQGSKTQAYWLVVRVLLTPPAEAAASQKWKIIYLQVLSLIMVLMLAIFHNSHLKVNTAFDGCAYDITYDLKEPEQ